MRLYLLFIVLLFVLILWPDISEGLKGKKKAKKAKNTCVSKSKGVCHPKACKNGEVPAAGKCPKNQKCCKKVQTAKCAKAKGTCLPKRQCKVKKGKFVPNAKKAAKLCKNAGFLCCKLPKKKAKKVTKKPIVQPSPPPPPNPSPSPPPPPNPSSPKPPPPPNPSSPKPPSPSTPKPSSQSTPKATTSSGKSNQTTATRISSMTESTQAFEETSQAPVESTTVPQETTPPCPCQKVQLVTPNGFVPAIVAYSSDCLNATVTCSTGGVDLHGNVNLPSEGSIDFITPGETRSPQATLSCVNNNYFVVSPDATQGGFSHSTAVLNVGCNTA